MGFNYSLLMKAIVDCNSFYASCEQVFQPRLEGKPVVVLSNNDGCLIARNDAAKALGIPMGQPYFMVRDLCVQQGVEVFSSNYALYGDLSRRVMATILSIYPDIEVYSIDEAFMDLDEKYIGDLDAFARRIRDRVLMWTGIPVSIGIAPTKVLSKVANRISKKNKALYDGVYVLQKPEDIEAALRKTPVGDVWGVGRRSISKLEYMGVDTAYKLSRMSEEWAHANMGGVVGVRLIRELNGIACIPMREGLVQKHNIASTRSFGNAVLKLSELKEAVATYTSRAAEKLRKQRSAAGVIYVFAVADDESKYRQHFRCSDTVVLPVASCATGELISYATKAVEGFYKEGVRYKKAGVVLSGIVPENSIQQNIFAETKDSGKQRKLSETLDKINRKMGLDTIGYAARGISTNWKMRCEVRSPRYTTAWKELRVIK